MQEQLWDAIRAELKLEEAPTPAAVDWLAEEADFHERVAAGFRALAQADPARWAIIHGVGTVEEVAGRVWDAYQRWAADRRASQGAS